MKMNSKAPKTRILTSALLLALATPLFAQSTAETEDEARSEEAEPETLDEIVVTGIIGSLQSSMGKASSTGSSPRTSANSPTPISPSPCSASAACRSTAPRAAKAGA
jgi:hypothetical protein